MTACTLGGRPWRAAHPACRGAGLSRRTRLTVELARWRSPVWVAALHRWCVSFRSRSSARIAAARGPFAVAGGLCTVLASVAFGGKTAAAVVASTRVDSGAAGLRSSSAASVEQEACCASPAQS